VGIRGIPFETIILDEPVSLLEDVPLEERIRKKLERFKGLKAGPTTEAMMAAVISGEIETARQMGEHIPEYEIAVFEEYGRMHVEVRPPQPPAPVPPKVKVPRGPSTPPDDNWETRMSKNELRWIWDQFKLSSKGLYCVDNYRAARLWKSTDRRRYNRIKSYGCCGSQDYIAERWNPDKKRHDLFLLGFNHGH
jgi:hypothetical protein